MDATLVPQCSRARKMSHLSQWLCAAVVALLSAAFSGVGAAPYLLKEDSISIEVPNSWAMENPGDPVILMAHTQPDSSGRSVSMYMNLVITRETVAPDLKALYLKDPKFYLQVTLLQAYKTFRIVQVNDRTVNGLRGVYMLGSMKEAKAEVRNLQFYTLVGSRLYAVTCTCLAADWQSALPIFEQMLSTFRKTAK